MLICYTFHTLYTFSIARGQIALTERQMKIIEFLNQKGSITNREIKHIQVWETHSNYPAVAPWMK